MPDILLFSLFLFAFGCAVGSFLNVIVDRTQDGENPLKGRSRCDTCKKPLSPLDLIPVLSFLFLRGKCRYCGVRLSYYYPIAELITGAAFAVSTRWIISQQAYEGAVLLIPIALLLVVISSLVVIFFADMKFGIIPFNAVVIGIIATFLWHVVFPISDTSITNYFLSAGALFLLLLLLFLATRGKGMGFGDVVYVAFMGLLLGFPKIVVGFYIAVLSGAAISLALVFLKKKKLRGSTIPFGPFLVAGTFIGLLWGQGIVDSVMAYLLRQ